MQATKCVTQPCESNELRNLLGECLTITYSAIAYGQENGINNRKGMKAFYQTLKGVRVPSCYKVATITRACAVLKSRKKSEKRGAETRHPRPLRPMVCIISGFFITMKGRLFIPLRRDKYFDAQLNHHVQQTLAGRNLRSLMITQNALSFCYSEEVKPLPIRSVFGVDRNEKNLTFGDEGKVTQIDLTETVRIRQTSREIVGSFRRNDVRLRRKLAPKYWKRASDRTNQMLHAATSLIVETAVEDGAAIALEDLAGNNRMYEKGNGQGPDYRFRLNSWPHQKAWKMLEYKAAWRGIVTIPLTRSETYGSSSVHWACGEKLRKPENGDAVHRRMLWCQACRVWMDRDVNAAVVLSQRGLARFASSHPRPKSRSQQALEAAEKGLAGEATKGNPTQPAILRVDASKLAHRPMVNTAIGHAKG